MKYELSVFKESLQRLLASAMDLILLNLLILLCCVPVVTAGAAWTAGYAYILRIMRGVDQDFPFKPFFQDFKKAFRTVTPGWLALLLCLVILTGDYYYAVYVSVPVNQFFLVFAIVLAVLLLMVSIWFFLLAARYENTTRRHIRNSFLMVAGTFPRTVLAFIVQALFLGLPFIISNLFLYLGWLWIFFGFSLPMYITAAIFRKPLKCELQKPGSENGQD